MQIFNVILLGFLIVCAISVSFSKNLLNSILIFMSYSLLSIKRQLRSAGAMCCARVRAIYPAVIPITVPACRIIQKSGPYFRQK